jgi:1-deoxy-D-xylulose 5-phosphate reductoisomerase
VIVLGSTGSIGVQALQVVAASRDLTVVGLSCDRNVRLLLEQALSLGVDDIAIADEAASATVNPSLFPELCIRTGCGAAARLVREVEADIVLNAIVGFAGLESTGSGEQGEPGLCRDPRRRSGREHSGDNPSSGLGAFRAVPVGCGCRF